jgi:hypothetical protein
LFWFGNPKHLLFLGKQTLQKMESLEEQEELQALVACSGAFLDQLFLAAVVGSCCLLQQQFFPFHSPFG